MAVGLCQTHGETISSLVCPEIMSAMNKNSNIKIILKIEEAWSGFDDKGQVFYISNHTYENYSLLHEEEITEDMEADYDALLNILVPVCNECFIVWLRNQNIENINTHKINLSP